ncbi:uncharacterized protein LOC110811535 [Carica papaya]|uniref:uncharacterized protein LOC110811535 n=1 Tax=Carica papaya TaxID=3649 RepID=UPI000B8C6E18|nr:uncharacterized protein LOC110811535 [Carica papaya]
MEVKGQTKSVKFRRKFEKAKLESLQAHRIPEGKGEREAWKSNWNETFLLILRCREPGLLVHASTAKAKPRVAGEASGWVADQARRGDGPLVSLILHGLPFPLSSNSSTYPEKLSAYECGFDPSGDARSRFDIRFYLVSILFIIPYPEVTFFFPWAVPPNKIDPFGFRSMMALLLILTIGFLYEWKRGASGRE